MPPSLPGLARKLLWKSSSQRVGFGTWVQEGSLLNLLVGLVRKGIWATCLRWGPGLPHRGRRRGLEPGCRSSDLLH